MNDATIGGMEGLILLFFSINIIIFLRNHNANVNLYSREIRKKIFHFFLYYFIEIIFFQVFFFVKLYDPYNDIISTIYMYFIFVYLLVFSIYTLYFSIKIDNVKLNENFINNFFIGRGILIDNKKFYEQKSKKINKHSLYFSITVFTTVFVFETVLSIFYSIGHRESKDTIFFVVYFICILSYCGPAYSVRKLFLVEITAIKNKEYNFLKHQIVHYENIEKDNYLLIVKRITNLYDELFIPSWGYSEEQRDEFNDLLNNFVKNKIKK